MRSWFKVRSRGVLDALADRLHARLSERGRKVRMAEVERLLAQVSLRGMGIEVKGTLSLSGAKCAALGNNVYIGDNVHISAEGGLVIGDNAHIGPNVTICTVDQEYEGKALPVDVLHRYRPVIIGRNVWIGRGAIITPGTRIGDGAIIGMGAVVAGEVPPMAVVAAPAPQLLWYREADRYTRLDAEKRYAGARGDPLTPEQVAAFHRPIAAAHPFFVVSTGRSGSMTVARVLSQHPEVTCLHEPRVQLIQLSTEWAERRRDRDQLRAELEAQYGLTVSPTPVYGESDQNLSVLLDPLLGYFPTARIVWLIRDGRDVVASTDAKGWYHSGPAPDPRRPVWDAFRLQGDRVGDVEPGAWASMSPFERNCWYWAYVNRTVRLRLSGLDETQWLQVRLEEFGEHTDALFEFIGVPPLRVTVEQHNRGKREGRRYDQWSAAEKDSFERICGVEMDLSYPSWRTG